MKAVPLFDWLEIETQGDCNRRCKTCLRQSYPHKENPSHQGRFPTRWKVGHGKKMEILTFKSIIDQAIDMGFTGTVNLQHYNEPLLDDRLAELAAYVKTKPEVKDVRAFTNGDLFDEVRAQELDGLFDIFHIALYMPREKQEIREEWLRGLFKKTHLEFTGGLHRASHYSPPEQWEDLDHYLYDTMDHANLEELIKVQREKPCLHNNHMLIIAYDGTILHCCEDYVGHFGLGNVNSMSLKDIWESPKHRQLVEDLSCAGGRKKNPYCDNCPREV
jgi:radical SAM protein with 4Fe4S-binding SPASM domain